MSHDTWPKQRLWRVRGPLVMVSVPRPAASSPSVLSEGTARGQSITGRTRTLSREPELTVGEQEGLLGSQPRRPQAMRGPGPSCQATVGRGVASQGP